MSHQRRGGHLALLTGLILIGSLLAAPPSGAAGNVVIEGHTVIVYPNGRDDTQNLARAFDRVPETGTLQLVTGTYHLSRKITVTNFSGTLRGTGIDSTVIQNVEARNE